MAGVCHNTRKRKKVAELESVNTTFLVNVVSLTKTECILEIAHRNLLIEITILYQAVKYFRGENSR